MSSDPLCFVSWRWQSPVGYRSVFGTETVYALKAMITKHYAHPFRFVCVTDQPKLLPGIETIPMWDDCAAIPSPFGRHNPSCYRRLKVFAPDAGKVFGPRLVSIDLDTVIVGDITPLFDRDDDFVIWGESDFPRKQWCNGSLWMLRTGTRPQVWTTFDPETSPARAARAGCKGSDQGWINYVLGKDIATWGRKDGVYSFRKHLFPLGDVLPADARIVAFHGRADPWGYLAQHFTWVKQHYPMDLQVPA